MKRPNADVPSEAERVVVAAIAPRVLDLPAAAAYLAISVVSLRLLIADGVVPTLRPPSPRRRGEDMRRVLLDIRDLDCLVESWRERSQ